MWSSEFCRQAWSATNDPAPLRYSTVFYIFSVFNITPQVRVHNHMAAALTIARAYQHSFETHPNTTLAIIGGCLNSLADVVAQVSQNTVRPTPFLFVFLLMYSCWYN